jgi:hypothetical protein
VPEVCWLLWPETLELLERWKSSHPEYVLTSKSGTVLWRDAIKDGKRSKTDLIHVQWNRGRGEGRAARLPISLKKLRSVAATIIESHREYGRYTWYFLGHAPPTVAYKNYAAPSQALFDEIILWLRAQVLGLAGTA